MTKEEILEIEGVWTAEEVAGIKSWIKEEGEDDIHEQHALAEKQAKTILEIAHVDLNELKVPFTFNL
ncbi:hypothetical protein [Mangrovimonas xylaniphaga]|uniref:hypothetical protein n=1 Tax=Mangrovimonas xylaniphaga TaxID=1645915 RepID=UPI0006B5B2DD|nr:hypothetical protein [Mangrovimonas xylaniphaga]